MSSPSRPRKSRWRSTRTQRESCFVPRRAAFWSANRQVEYVEVVFDEPLEPSTFRPSWTTSEGTSIYADALTGLLEPPLTSARRWRARSRAGGEHAARACRGRSRRPAAQINDRYGHRIGNAALRGRGRRDTRRPSLGGHGRPLRRRRARRSPSRRHGIDEAQRFDTRLREHIAATPIEPFGRISLVVPGSPNSTDRKIGMRSSSAPPLRSTARNETAEAHRLRRKGSAFPVGPTKHHAAGSRRQRHPEQRVSDASAVHSWPRPATFMSPWQETREEVEET